MIADGIVPYILHHHGLEASSFFDPEALLDKEDWKWDEKTNSIINPLSDELAGLENMDRDFVFDMGIVGATATTEENASPPTPATPGNVPTAQELAIAKMNVLVNEQDAETVSTMGSNPKSISGHLIRMTPGKQSSRSVLSQASHESRLTAVEDQLKSLESNLTASFQNSIKDLVSQLTGKQTPPADSATGGNNE